MIEDVLKRLNMDKHRDQVIMVGDKEHDVYGARKAGLECIQFLLDMEQKKSLNRQNL